MNWRKFLFLLRRDRFENDLADEMRLHLDLRAERLRNQGVSNPAAAARRAFGNATHLAETSRQTWTWRWFEETIRDAAYAIRALRGTMSFTLTVAICLAAGIGGATAFFSILRHVVLRPFPYADPSYNAAAVGTGLAKPLNARYRVRAILQRARHHREFLLFQK